MNIQGRRFILSNDKYVKMQVKNRVVYLGTHHDAACFFTILAFKDGIISGQEKFLHIDSSAHPDNLSLPLWFCPPSLESDLITFRIFFSNNHGIDRSNYVTALPHFFPEMKFNFLHEPCEFSVPDWGVMHFAEEGSIFSYQCLEKDDVASIDLDVTNNGSLQLFEKIFEVINTCKVSMIFVSPDFTNPKTVMGTAGGLINKLISTM